MSINDVRKPLHIRIRLNFWKNNGKVKIYHSSKTKRIYHKVKAEKFLKAYLKVFYGKAITNNGRLEEITNSGTYESRKDLLEALSVFTEKSLLEDTEKWISESSKLGSHKVLLNGSARTRE